MKTPKTLFPSKICTLNKRRRYNFPTTPWFNVNLVLITINKHKTIAEGMVDELMSSTLL